MDQLLKNHLFLFLLVKSSTFTVPFVNKEWNVASKACFLWKRFSPKHLEGCVFDNYQVQPTFCYNRNGMVKNLGARSVYCPYSYHEFRNWALKDEIGYRIQNQVIFVETITPLEPFQKVYEPNDHLIQSVYAKCIEMVPFPECRVDVNVLVHELLIPYQEHFPNKDETQVIEACFWVLALLSYYPQGDEALDALFHEYVCVDVLLFFWPNKKSYILDRFC